MISYWPTLGQRFTQVETLLPQQTYLIYPFGFSRVWVLMKARQVARCPNR